MDNAKAIIYFPKGEYILHTAADDVDGKSQTIQLLMGGVILKGDGRDQTVIKMVPLTNRPIQVSCIPHLSCWETSHNSGLPLLPHVTGNARKGGLSQ